MSKKQIEKIQSQINYLKRVKTEKTYLAAGLQIGFNVGICESYDIEMEFGAYSCIEEEIIDLLLKGLESAKDRWIKSLQKETEENLNFLNSLREI